jgi:RNA polymerase sigma-70 factor, ECF subfamily
VAGTFSSRAGETRPAPVDGAVEAVRAPGGRPRGVVRFTITRERIVTIESVADPGHVRQLDLVLLNH